jgi:hypothetical protein
MTFNLTLRIYDLTKHWYVCGYVFLTFKRHNLFDSHEYSKSFISSFDVVDVEEESEEAMWASLSMSFSSWIVNRLLLLLLLFIKDECEKWNGLFAIRELFLQKKTIRFSFNCVAHDIVTRGGISFKFDDLTLLSLSLWLDDDDDEINASWYKLLNVVRSIGQVKHTLSPLNELYLIFEYNIEFWYNWSQNSLFFTADNDDGDDDAIVLRFCVRSKWSSSFKIRFLFLMFVNSSHFTNRINDSFKQHKWTKNKTKIRK